MQYISVTTKNETRIGIRNKISELPVMNNHRKAPKEAKERETPEKKSTS